ncbi:unnamed protein product [Paramecium primaurelia]|uniref:Leucine-rich repeat protein n=1 Tax=Paramecium primaurelia TaxID=5886 RepID=A0A8S1PU10_PARPR|nr:unnamed protein product [Paramecium primaurelia]
MNKDSRNANMKSSMSPNKNLRHLKSSQTHITKKTNLKATQQQNQAANLNQFLDIQKINNNNDGLRQQKELQKIFTIEQDERYRYLIKNGITRKIENGGNIIFSELQQIPGVWICYRRPQERQENTEKLNLDNLDLQHIPLFEGEENLKILFLQHNRIGLIKNLISLPNLLYLDLYDNQIKDIEELEQLQKLKVLLLPKNQIRNIQNLDSLQKLEVLDLHSNNITHLKGLNKLKNLKVLNLGNNMVQKLENLEDLTSLIELNLNLNQIEFIEHIQVLPKLQKLFLSSNKINQYPQIFDILELSLENNPISYNKTDYYQYICQNYKQLRILDQKLVDMIKQEILSFDFFKRKQIKKNQYQSIQQQSIQQQSIQQQQQAIEVNANEDKVLTIIKRQWIQEIKRIQELEQSNQFNQKSCLEHQILEGGHAEVENDTSLIIFGAAVGIVLPANNFRQKIEKIQFQYVFFDSIIYSQLQVIKEYTRLQEIILKDNYIHSLRQLIQLEDLTYIQKIIIQNNPINNCSFMFSFLIYRIPTLIQINSKNVRYQDRQKAKSLFQNFDDTLITKEKNQNIRQFKSYQKNTSYIQTYQNTINEVINQYKIVINKQKLFDNFLEDIQVQ